MNLGRLFCRRLSTQLAATPGSRLSGFHRLDLPARLSHIGKHTNLEPLTTPVPHELLDAFVENVVGAFSLPLGVATNFKIDGTDVLVPMAVEESSVVAAASNMAARARSTGGFVTQVVTDLVIGQVQVILGDGMDEREAERAHEAVLRRKDEVVARANACDPKLVALGGGCRDIEVRRFAPHETGGDGHVLVVHLLVDARDAMGANAVNTMAEALAPTLCEWTGGTTGLRILSNLADRRVFRAQCSILPEELGVGELPGQ